jgi:hypothetical protein
MSEDTREPDGERPAPTGLHKVLADATALISPGLLRDLKKVGPRVKQLEQEGNYAFWMDLLFRVGAAAEQLGRDAELPADFWYNLAGAARGMKFPQFVPFALGKAEGRPKRRLADVMAAIVVIRREIGGRWPRSFPDQPTLMDEVVGLIAAVDPGYPELLKTEPSTELAGRFAADGCNADPSPAGWYAARHRYYDLFPPLFAFVQADDFPDSLSDERWSVLSFNLFEVRMIEGRFPGTEAKPWWA